MNLVHFIECDGYRIPIPYMDYREACRACDEMAYKNRCSHYRIVSVYIGE